MHNIDFMDEPSLENQEALWDAAGMVDDPAFDELLSLACESITEERFSRYANITGKKIFGFRRFWRGVQKKLAAENAAAAPVVSHPPQPLRVSKASTRRIGRVMIAVAMLATVFASTAFGSAPLSGQLTSTDLKNTTTDWKIVFTPTEDYPIRTELMDFTIEMPDGYICFEDKISTSPEGIPVSHDVAYRTYDKFLQARLNFYLSQSYASSASLSFGKGWFGEFRLVEGNNCTYTYIPEKGSRYAYWEKDGFFYFARGTMDEETFFEIINSIDLVDKSGA